MKYFHGSLMKDLRNLSPKNDFVYVTTNEVIATFYMIKNKFYTYGFKEDSDTPIYTEYYNNALYDIYKGKTGYLYECYNVGFKVNPQNIKYTFVSEGNIPINKVEKIEDIYEKLLEYENKGKLIIERYSELSGEKLENISNIIINEIRNENLINKNDSYSNFIKSKFQQEWNIVLNNY